MYLRATSQLISCLFGVRGTNKRPTMLQRLGIGGLCFLILMLGVVSWVYSLRNYPLVLHDMPTILNTPAAFFYAGLFLTFLTFLWLWCLSKLHRRKIGWAIRQGHKRSALQWEDMIVSVIIGVMCGTIGACQLINGAFDHSPIQSHQSKIIRLYTKDGSRGGTTYHVLLSDWENSQSNLTFQIGGQTYQALHKAKYITVKTQSGALGYEWTGDFR